MESPKPEPDEGSTQNQASEDKKFRKRAMVLAEKEARSVGHPRLLRPHRPPVPHASR